MTEAEELEQIENDVADLGRQIAAKRDRALEILRDRVAVIRGRRFRIRSAQPYFGGSDTRLFFSGPVLKQDGTHHARHTESTPLGLLEKIEPVSSPDGTVTRPDRN